MKSQSDALLRAALRQTKLEPLPDEIKRQIMHQVYCQYSMTKSVAVKPLVTSQTWLISGLVTFMLLILVSLLEVMHKVTVLPFIKWVDQPSFAMASMLCITLFVLIVLDRYLFKKWLNFGLSA